MNIVLQPVRIASEDGEGMLVFNDSVLIAVLTRLSDEHGDLSGQWFLEIGFRGLDSILHTVFADLDTARAWMTDLLNDERA